MIENTKNHISEQVPSSSKAHRGHSKPLLVTVIWTNRAGFGLVTCRPSSQFHMQRFTSDSMQAKYLKQTGMTANGHIGKLQP